MKRQSCNIIQDYQNPTKSRHFSPSPIKRYTSKTHYYANDNKENLESSSRTLFTAKFKRPLALQKSFKSDNLCNLSQNNLEEQPFIVPLKTSSIQNLERTERFKLKEDQKPVLKEMLVVGQQEKLKNDQRIIEEDLSLGCKRKDKQEFKSQMKMKRFENQRELLEVAEIEKQQEEEAVSQIENSKVPQNNENVIQLNKNLSEKCETQMEEFSHQSVNSLINGVQFQGRWTQEEHLKFVEGLKIFGKDWKKIEEHIGSRTCAQIRSHAQKYFNRLQKELTKETKQEDTRMKESNEESKEHSLSSTYPQFVASETIAFATNQQLQLIQEKFAEIAEKDLQLHLNSLIEEREQLSKSVMSQKISSKDACARLISITKKFHNLALNAYSNKQLEICQRLIDERNLSQFICILLAKQVIVVPQSNQPQFFMNSLQNLNSKETALIYQNNKYNYYQKSNSTSYHDQDDEDEEEKFQFQREKLDQVQNLQLKQRF